MIRGIIFDCFGVLYQGSLDHLREYVPREDWPELNNLRLSSDYGYLSREEFVGQVGQLARKSPAEIEAIMRTSHVRNEPLVSYVRTLRLQYKVAMLSNVGRGLIEQLFTRQELSELFDTTVLSSEVGMVKPDPAIFSFTSDKMGILPEDCLMIDDLKANIDGARQIGMHGVVFSTTSQLISDIENDTLA